MNVGKSSLLTAGILCGLAASAFADDPVTERVAGRAEIGADTGFFKASDLIGMEVRGTDNAELGEVQDLFIDRRTHEVEYLILDTGVFADLDGKQPIVPWMLVDTHAGADAGTYYLSLPMTQERIKGAPTITLGDIDLTRSPSFVADVDAYYSAELKQRRVSRPDLDQSRENAAPRSLRDNDRNTPERSRRNPNATDSTRDNPKPDAKPDSPTNKPNPTTAPKKPVNP